MGSSSSLPPVPFLGGLLARIERIRVGVEMSGRDSSSSSRLQLSWEVRILSGWGEHNHSERVGAQAELSSEESVALASDNGGMRGMKPICTSRSTSHSLDPLLGGPNRMFRYPSLE